jgi:hypothetical protein
MTDKLPAAKFPPWGYLAHERYEMEMAKKSDMVNNPQHYTKGKYEAIDVIEDAVQHAPNAVQGTLQWQTLKYLLRMWNKNNALEDAKKARWYLDRLINKLENK